MIYLIYHKIDLDGLCSLAIAMKKLGAENIGKTYRTFGYHYGDEIPFETFSDATQFILMDVFPIPYSEMHRRLAEICDDIVVLDHHKTFIESPVNALVKGLTTTRYSGCELAWKYFYGDELAPTVVSLLGRYDRWDKNQCDWNEIILPFQYGAKMILENPLLDFDQWDILLRDEDEIADELKDDIMTAGHYSMIHARERNEVVMKSNSIVGTFDGLKVLACNDGSYSSSLFDSMWDEEKYDAMLGYSIRSNGMVSASLYATKESVDCTPVAAKYGGGGHKHACGFSMSIEQFFKTLVR